MIFCYYLYLKCLIPAHLIMTLVKYNADDTTLMAESEEELESLLKKVKAKPKDAFQALWFFLVVGGTGCNDLTYTLE